MRYRYLGRTGLRVSELCLGTMTFGSRFLSIGKLSQAEATQMTREAIASGINFLDTANVYSYGESEEITGKALKDCGVGRDALIIATKVFGQMNPEPKNQIHDVTNFGLSRQHIIASCEASLKRLQTDYIDLYQVHGWDPVVQIEETLRALDDLVRQGKVRYLGCSNWSARHLAKALVLSGAKGWERFATLQAYYSLVGRDLEHELLPLCAEEGVGVLPWSPLAGGFLSGKYKRDAAGMSEGRRTNFEFPPVDKERGFQAIEVLGEIAAGKGASVAQVALAWLLARPAVSSVIIGASKVAQLHDNLRASGLSLSEDEMALISKTTAPEPLYPGWMIARQGMAFTRFG